MFCVTNTLLCGWRAALSNGFLRYLAQIPHGRGLTSWQRNMSEIIITSNSSAMSRMFLEYASWNQRETPDLFVAESRKFANELYMQTAAIAPSKATISAKVKSLGWHVIKRGSSSQWKGAALAKKAKRKGRGAGAINDATRDKAMAAKATLEQMQAYVIAKRSNARLYLASGWLGAVSDLGGSLKISSGNIDHTRGGAEVFRSPSHVEIEFWNRTPGIVEQDAKHNLVGRAYAVRMADMLEYIERKRREAADRIFKKAA